MFPKICIHSYAYVQHFDNIIRIAPFSSGDTTLQSYNSILSLAHFQEYSDTISLFHNDVLMADVLKTSGKSREKNVLKLVNTQIAHCISSTVNPLYNTLNRQVYD